MTIHTAEISQATVKLAQSTNKSSLRPVALIAGIGLLIMAIAAPFAELYAYPQLIVPGNAAEKESNDSK